MKAADLSEELRGGQYGDERLSKRAGKIADALSRKPNVSLPAALQSRADIEACYRFFDNEKVTPEKILQPHIDATYRRISQVDFVLLVQDTTEIDLTRPEQPVDGAGPMDCEVIFEASEWKSVYVTLGLPVPARRLPASQRRGACDRTLGRIYWPPEEPSWDANFVGWAATSLRPVHRLEGIWAGRQKFFAWVTCVVQRAAAGRGAGGGCKVNVVCFAVGTLAGMVVLIYRRTALAKRTRGADRSTHPTCPDSYSCSATRYSYSYSLRCVRLGAGLRPASAAGLADSNDQRDSPSGDWFRVRVPPLRG